MKKVGILGGTFNPVHVEHVNLALSAVEELNLDELIVMPTYISPHKTEASAPAENRLDMLKIAFKDYDKITVSDYEIEKQGKSFTYLTVEHFKSQGDIDLYFIVGGDMLTDFKTWKFPERILSACTLAVFDREEFFTDYALEEEYFMENFHKKFVRLSYRGKDASSTKIRVYSSFSLPLDGIAPDGVGEYISKCGLYGGDKYTNFIKKYLPPKRVKHTADVLICALKKAKSLKLDTEKVKIAATLHDCAKYLDYTKIEGFVLPDGVPAPVVHSYLGAFVAEKYLGVTDEEVLDAIRYHTSGKAEMSTLGKLIFVADMVEEGRDYDGVEVLRALYEKDDFEKCFIECLKEEFLHLINKKQYIYAETINAFNYYVKN
ncbi:MAG: nicotinate (nicotinamide) nucleotide adenylyltransferase [Clostridia bacterium]|nr:nicotinate (nicotinamide) nucleotide adenylyltransferase [Clostridia bacterium]